MVDKLSGASCPCRGVPHLSIKVLELTTPSKRAFTLGKSQHPPDDSESAKLSCEAVKLMKPLDATSAENNSDVHMETKNDERVGRSALSFRLSLRSDGE